MGTPIFGYSNPILPQSYSAPLAGIYVSWSVESEVYDNFRLQVLVLVILIALVSNPRFCVVSWSRIVQVSRCPSPSPAPTLESQDSCLPASPPLLSRNLVSLCSYGSCDRCSIIRRCERCRSSLVLLSLDLTLLEPLTHNLQPRGKKLLPSVASFTHFPALMPPPSALGIQWYYSHFF